ncbi:MAG: TonB-dependent receptor [bacterium]|nr:TonB-dependent receptor [bacterium]
MIIRRYKRPGSIAPNRAHRIFLSLLTISLLWGLIIGQISYAGTLKGKVTDATTGEPLLNVNVTIPGTYLGAATDINGAFTIQNVPAGAYEIRITCMGYTQQLLSSITVTATGEKNLQVKMQPTVLSMGQEMTVVGERPLIEVDETSSRQRISAEEIKNLVVEDVDDLLSNQLGVTKENNEIHIRGGRADENLYRIDGISIKDPISGSGYGIYLSADAIEELEVITGGFNAEYGQAMSGVVEIKTKEGGDHYSGSATLKTDSFGSEYPSANQGIRSADFSLGGPLPWLHHSKLGKSTFFLNGYGFTSNTYLPHAGQLLPYSTGLKPFAPGEENNWSGLAKVTWWPQPRSKILFSYGRSLQINQGYFQPLIEDRIFFPLNYSNILDNYNTFTWEGIQSSVTLTQTLSSRAFFELQLGRFYNRVHSAPRGFDYNDSTYVVGQPFDISPTIYYSDPQGNIVTKTGDGLYDVGYGYLWHDHYSNTLSLKGDLTAKVGKKHQMKTGFEVENTELQMLHINDPWLGVSQGLLGGDWDMYHAYTSAVALYAQDKIEFEGMIADVGLRFDGWFPGKYVERAVENTNSVSMTDEARQYFYDNTFNFLGYRGKGHLSPRLGISHPITEGDVLFLSYGHFSQRPKYAYIYSKLGSGTQSTFQLFGNPNLDPTTTIAYEMGIKHRFSADRTIELVAFYKDLFDYATSFQIRDVNRGTTYYEYFNIDNARVRGLEMRLRARWQHLSARLDATYQIATGKSSSSTANLQAAAGNVLLQNSTLGESYLNWDRPIRIALDLFYRIGPNERPQIFGLRLPSDWGGSIRWEIESGKRYTPGRQTAQGDIQYDPETNSSLSDPWNTVDAKVYKDFHLKSVVLNFFMEVENLFNFKKPRSINPLTGEAYEPGDPHPLTWENNLGQVLLDPSRYEEPRKMMFGMGVKF